MPEIPSQARLGRIVGELAVKHGLIQSSDLDKAIDACRNLDKSDEMIPEILVSEGLISEKDRLKLMAVTKTRQTRHLDLIFGQMAIKKGVITPSILQLALDEQTALFKETKHYTLLGDILVDAGMMSPKQRDDILRSQGRLNKDEFPPSQSDSSGQDSNGEAPPSSDVETSPSKKNFASSEVLPSGIKLIVQEDGNAAFFLKTEAFSPTISIGQIKELLATRNILHGIVENNEIQHFIDSENYYKKAFKVAQGNAPAVSQGATVKYLFPRHKLKAGTIREDGTIDFRERGEIPQVEKGAVLAVKKNVVKGKAGKNIFNDLVLPPKDIRLKAGRGAYLSEDRLQVIAAVSGHPKISRDGVIFVYENYVIQGDVDFETGNIDYQGDVIVKGCVQNGFKVKGNNIKAESTDGAILVAEGNVTVTQGITESNIFARGSLSARFVQTSKIGCLGDLKTDKEVVDSHLECSGKVVINGVVIHSTISAKMGLYAAQIGMEKAPPSTIRVGIDTFAAKEADTMEQEIERIKEDEQALIGDITNLHEAIATTKARISRISVTKDREDEERLMLLSILSDDNHADPEKNAQLKDEMNRLINSVDEINRTIDQCRDKIRENEQILAEKELMLHRNRETLQRLIEERKTLSGWMDQNPGFSMVKVEGRLMAGTKIFSRHTEKIIQSSISGVVVKEDQENRSRDGDDGTWKMYIAKL